MIKVKRTIDMEDEYYYSVGKVIKYNNKNYKIKEMKCLDIGNTWTDYEFILEET